MSGLIDIIQQQQADSLALVGTIGTGIATVATAVLAGWAQVRKVNLELKARIAEHESDVKTQLAEQLALIKVQSQRITELETERDELRRTIEGQTTTIADQAARLTTTIQALTSITLERDSLVRQVETLTIEREQLKREIEVLTRRVESMTKRRGRRVPAKDAEHVAEEAEQAHVE